MKPTSQLYCAALALIAWAALDSSVSAHNPVGSDRAGELSALANQSNLVFVGRVASVDYRLSESSTEGDGAIPYTTVTYAVDEIFRGDLVGQTFTMRFIGGPNGMGRFLDVSGVPQFEQGDQDLLFISGNGEQACPLVLCEWGRFRIHEGGVYNAKGAPVRAVIKNNVIARGPVPSEFLSFRFPAPRFDDLIRNPEVQALIKEQNMPLDQLRERYESEAPKQIEISAGLADLSNKNDTSKDLKVRPTLRQQLKRTPVQPIKPQPVERQLKKPLRTLEEKAATVITRPDLQIAAIATTPDDLPDGPMAIEEFISHVKRIAGDVERQPQLIESIDFDALIYFTPPNQSVPQSVEAGKFDSGQMTPEDRAEFEALQKQDFDPVIRRK